MFLKSKMPSALFLLLFIIIITIVSACGANTPEVTPPVLLAASPTPSPTPIPEQRVLKVCLGDEPNTLYRYANPNKAAWSVLSAIYDGPMDQIDYEYQPVIFEDIPSLENGQAQITTTKVQTGDEIIDAAGQPVTLEEGVMVKPTGCRMDDCAVTYDGLMELSMDQMVVNFRIIPNLVWSDGTPLTATDSVYAYQLANDPETPGSRYLLDRTRAYEAADNTTIQWWGKPGFIDPTYFTNYWLPLPEHLWNTYSAQELPGLEQASRMPVGWGPYVIEEWLPGEQIELTKNLNYFRIDEGLPKFDTLIFRFMPDPNQAISALLDGACDILDPSIPLDGQTPLLLELQNAGQAKLIFGQNMAMERLDFGILPSAYDDPYAFATINARPDILSDVRTRQAVALCLDRQKVVDTVLYGLSVVPDTYISPGHPLFYPEVDTYAFNVGAGIQLLEEIGWRDLDNDPATPRQAQNIEGIPQATPLVLGYVTSSAAQRRQVSDILSQSLGQCGIGVDISYLSQVELYADGPEGPLFGRNFFLAEYAMGSTGPEPPCAWFMNSSIPAEENDWVGTNLSGYVNEEYDDACRLAMQSLPGDMEYEQGYRSTQVLFSSELPSIPLYMRLDVAASRVDMCNFVLSTTASSNMWGLETFDYGDGCDS
ncbi:MAG: hypothetical protein JXA13_10395 [Anaerolineales bacterium]|nr:hypothetical protein [Anaerolineales bacterium]